MPLWAVVRWWLWQSTRDYNSQVVLKIVYTNRYIVMSRALQVRSIKYVRTVARVYEVHDTCSFLRDAAMLHAAPCALVVGAWQSSDNIT